MNCLSSSEGEGQSSAICYNTDYRMFERQWEQRTSDADSSTTSDGEINFSFFYCELNFITIIWNMR